MRVERQGTSNRQADRLSMIGAWELMAFAGGYTAGWLFPMLSREQLVAIMLVLVLITPSAITRPGRPRACE